MKENFTEFIGDFLNIWQTHSAAQQLTNSNPTNDYFIHQLAKMLGEYLPNAFKEDVEGNVHMFGFNLTNVYNFIIFITIPLSILIKVFIFVFNFFRHNKLQDLQEEKLNAEINLLNHADEAITARQANLDILTKRVNDSELDSSIDVITTVSETTQVGIDEELCVLLKKQGICTTDVCNNCLNKKENV